MPFELRPQLPAAGVSAREHGLAHSERVEERLLAVAEKETGSPMLLPDLVPNTHLAMALAEHARDVDAETHWRVHQAIFAAYYVDGRDIGDREALLSVARAEGLDADAVTTAWDEGRFDARLHEFEHLALHLGVNTTPSALICYELLIGSRPYGVLRDSATRCLSSPGPREVQAMPSEGEVLGTRSESAETVS